jgi:hypothetical protein
LYKYWDRIRNNRRAPRRFEIEPSEISPILSETFILERRHHDDYRFRIAGTRICEHFGKELRGLNVLDFWQPPHWQAVCALLDIISEDAAAGVIQFRAYAQPDRKAEFEMVLLPLIHREPAISRVLGAIAPMATPYWLGMVPLTRFEILKAEEMWPSGFGHGGAGTNPEFPYASNAQDHRIVEVDRRRFRIYDGGLSNPTKSS